MKRHRRRASPVPTRAVRELMTKARRDRAAGDPVEHAIVGEWLRSWDKSGIRSFAEWLGVPEFGRYHSWAGAVSRRLKRRPRKGAMPLPLTRKHRPRPSPRP